jgi:hypothetical protein
VNTDIETIQQTDKEQGDLPTGQAGTHCRPFVFYFFPTAHFLKTNAKHSRAPLENKLNKRVILASPQVAHLPVRQAGLALPHSQTDPSAKLKEPLLCQCLEIICDIHELKLLTFKCY